MHYGTVTSMSTSMHAYELALCNVYDAYPTAMVGTVLRAFKAAGLLTHGKGQSAEIISASSVPAAAVDQIDGSRAYALSFLCVHAPFICALEYIRAVSGRSSHIASTRTSTVRQRS